MAEPQPAAAEAVQSAGSQPPAQVVGNAFVHQYYHILHQSPDLVYRFYQEASRLGRPAEHGGDMDSVTTMEAINEKIMAMDMVRAEIRTVDAQESLGGGVTVLVTGHLTGRDAVRREFAQSFFLAPQEKGYFVLNDMFRYVGQGEHGTTGAGAESHPQPQPEVDATVPAGSSAGAVANGTAERVVEQAPLEQDAAPQQEKLAAEHAPVQPQEVEEENEEEVYNPPEDVEGAVVDEEQPVPEVIDEVPNNVPTVAVATPVSHEEAPKKSYASIVKVMKEAPLPAPSLPARPAPPKPEKQAPIPPAAAPVADVPAFSSNPESSNVQEPEVDGHAIYIRNLPLNATPAQLDDEFKRFGTIKRNGIQVRSHKIQGFCYGFVEFEEASAVQSAKEACPVNIGGRQCYVEEKRTTGSRGPSRGRFATGRGNNFRSEGMRGRGSYGGGRSYGRGEFSYRVDYGGRSGGRGGSSTRGPDVGYQRVDHTGPAGGRGSRAPSAANAATK